MIAFPRIPERGEVYRLNFRGAHAALRGPHYAVVVSDEPYNRLSTVVVIPFSSHAAAASFRPEAIINGTRTRALVEQITSVSRILFSQPLESIAGTTVMAEIEYQLRDLLGLDAY